ncbi:MAG: 7-carboxy-7-deazaguanine synthase QueE [Candidatus Omnitrophota bacterium]|nr:7-carboxy-7-deazaguanine synthase QueE [Candidatus Omnitrophota bacterium]
MIKPSLTGKVSEVFSSIQGEGLYTGARQLFVRFYGCNLDCVFCDTQLSSYEKYTPEELYGVISRFEKNYHSISFTGGEPLLQKDFLREVLKLIKRDGIKTYLETNGILHKELQEVIDYIDIIAMDFKLPTSGKHEEYWQEHKKFLETAVRKEVFVKCIVCLSTHDEDIEKVMSLIKGSGKDIPLIIQPNTFELGRRLLDKAKAYQDTLFHTVSDVRIIPQVHKYLAVH